MNAYPIDKSAYPVGSSAYPVDASAYPVGGGSGPPSPAAPEPQAMGFMNHYGPAPGVVQQPRPALQPPMQQPGIMAGIMNQAPVGAEPPMPTNQQAAAYPKSGGIGPNGFGIHPDTTQDDIVEYLLPKFQQVESSGDPTNYPGKAQHLPYKHGDSAASGLYQYTPGTWGNYKGYARAMDAPPEIQTEKMKQDLKATLARFGNDPYKTIAHHYRQANAHDPTSWDNPIPVKYKSGRIPPTVSQYVHSVLQAGNDPAGHRFQKYLQGVNPHRQGANNQATLQLP